MLSNGRSAGFSLRRFSGSVALLDRMEVSGETRRLVELGVMENSTDDGFGEFRRCLLVNWLETSGMKIVRIKRIQKKSNPKNKINLL